MHVNLHMNVGGTPSLGYTKMEIALWRELLALGVTVTPSGKYAAEVHRVLPGNVLASLAKPAGGIAPITIATRQVRQVQEWHLLNTRIWLYTMAESDKIRPSRVDDINRRCERIIVPCPQLVDIYQDSGVTVPVHYIPLGVDYYPVEPVRRRVDGDFRWLGYSLGGSRKGAQFAAMAYGMKFKQHPKVKLWLKTKGDRESWLDNCMEDGIVTLPGTISESAWFELLGDVHAFVFPTMGEGFGLPPREAALRGLPTIATPWLGTWDVDHWGYGVKIKRKRRVMYTMETVNADDANWVEPDFMDLAEQMWLITSNYDRACEKAMAGREYLLANFTWQQTARAVVELLEQYA